MFAVYRASAGRIRLTHFTGCQLTTDAATYGAVTVPAGRRSRVT